MGFNDGVATASRSASSGVATPNHTYTAATQADVAAGYNNGPAFAYGAGMTLAKDNQVVYQKVITGGNAAGYKALGASESSQ